MREINLCSLFINMVYLICGNIVNDQLPFFAVILVTFITQQEVSIISGSGNSQRFPYKAIIGTSIFIYSFF